MTTVFVFIFLFACCNASHFRGGTISWRYVGPGYKVQFKFKLSWVLGGSDKSPNWMAYPLNGGSSFPIGNVSYTMTANNTVENWEQGEKTFTYDFNSPGPYRVSYASSAWITLADGTGGNWNIETIVDLNVRNDTHRPNYSPLTTSRAIYRAQFGCPISMQVPISDADADLVKCRWATVAEAASIANKLPNAVLDEDTCSIDFSTVPGSSYINNVWYAVAVTVVDFPRQPITINGKVYTPTTPISSTPLQFLIRTESMSGGCDEIPEFKAPTPNEGSLTIIKANDTMILSFYVHSSIGLRTIDISGPANMQKSILTVDSQGRPNVWYVNVTWTPEASDQGTNIICASAEDNNGKISKSRCITVSAWDIDPCESLPCANMGTCQRIGYTNDFTCTCVQGFTGIRCQIDINECASSPCGHRGECLDLINTYQCHCSEGYVGFNCETDINECGDKPCKNNGTCLDLVNDYSCTCKRGYTGRNCQFDINECASSPCQNNATCVDGVASWDCECLQGYTGSRCETEINECYSNPCQNNGTCIDLIDGFSCQCPNVTSGDICEIWLDHCRSSPCLHGGVCSNHYGGFTCDCPNPWHGEVCEYEHINKTGECTDLDYTECSCRISKLKSPVKKSYKILTGAVGTLVGLVSTVLSYVMWSLLDRTAFSNRIKPEQKEIKEYIGKDSDTSTIRNDSVSSVSPEHCKCFVDHSGYDHFKRYDEKNSRFKFHKCQHKR